MALTQISTEGIKNGTITGSDLATNVDLVDDQKLRLGTGNDLELFHSASSSRSFILNNTGHLIISNMDPDENNEIHLRARQNEQSIVCKNDGGVELYHNNSKKFETTSYGAAVTGGINFSGDSLVQDNVSFFFGTGSDLQIVHDGSNNFIRHDAPLYIRQKSNTENMALFIPNGAVELYHNSNKKFETASYGAVVTGTFQSTGNIEVFDNGKLNVGTSADLQIYHDGSNSFIKDAGTGSLVVQASIFAVNNAAGTEQMMKAVQDGAVELNYDGSKKLETTSGGINVVGNVKADGIRLDDNDEIRVGTGDDLKIFHDGSSSRIYNATGSFVIRSDAYYFNSQDGLENLIKAVENGSVELYYNNVERVTTKDNGAKITGALEIDGGTVQGNGDATLYVHANSNNDWGCVIDAFSNGKSNYGLKVVAESGASHVFSIVQGSGHAQKLLIDADGDMNTSGNVTAANFIGNGSQLTNLPASATNSPAFSAYRSSNYSPSNGSEVVIDFDQERFDTDGCYNFNNGRFTPTTAGNYQFNLTFFWSGTSSNRIKQAHGYIRKNGSENLGQFWHDPNDSYLENRQGVSVSTIVAMNGSSDYVEAIGYCLVNGGSPRFNAQGATFSGFKLA